MTRRETLQFIKNTGGYGTVAGFKEQWRPVGDMEWGLLIKEKLAEEKDGRIYLTEKGEMRLKELQ